MCQFSTPSTNFSPTTNMPPMPHETNPGQTGKSKKTPQEEQPTPQAHGNNFNNPLAFGSRKTPTSNIPSSKTSTNKTQSTTPTSKTTGKSASDLLFEAVNKARREHGLKELTRSAPLSDAAKQNNLASIKNGSVGHHVGLINGAMGEITYGSPEASNIDPAAAVQAWLDSPGHHDIMLNPNYTQFGADTTGGFATVDFA